MAKKPARFSPNPRLPLVPDCLGVPLMHHLSGHPFLDEEIIINFCDVFGYSRSAVENFLFSKNFLPPSYRTLH